MERKLMKKFIIVMLHRAGIVRCWFSTDDHEWINDPDWSRNKCKKRSSPHDPLAWRHSLRGWICTLEQLVNSVWRFILQAELHFLVQQWITAQNGSWPKLVFRPIVISFSEKSIHIHIWILHLKKWTNFQVKWKIYYFFLYIKFLICIHPL